MTSGEAQTEVVRAVDFLRVTEGAALASGRWLGRGDAEAAERAAVEAMRQAVDELPVSGTLVIGSRGRESET